MNVLLMITIVLQVLTLASSGLTAEVTQRLQHAALDDRLITLSRDELARFDAVAFNKSIVFLGEPDHYIAEKYDYRLSFLEHLIARGFRTVAMEMGVLDGQMVDLYLKTGDETYLERVGVYRTSENKAYAPGKAAFVREEKRFLRLLRKLQDEHSVSIEWRGFDIDSNPTVVFEALNEMIQAAPYSKNLNELKSLVDLHRQIAKKDHLELARQIAAWFGENRQRLAVNVSEEKIAQLDATIHHLVESCEHHDALNSPGADLMNAHRRREEQVMMPNVKSIIEERRSRGGIVFMGHNMHLSKSTKSLSFGGLSEGSSFFPMWPSVGEYIAHGMPGSVAGIWLMYAGGNHWFPGDANCNFKVACDVPSLPLSIEQTFSRKFGHAFVEPLPVKKSLVIQNGLYGTANLFEAADAVYFTTTVRAPYRE